MTQDDLLRRTIDVLERIGVTYMVVGAYASSAHGEPRFTQDIDIVVKLDVDDVGVLAHAFPEPDFYLDQAAARQAVRSGNMFNVIAPAAGMKIGFVMARNDPWSRTELSNRRRVRILPDLEADVADPADVIIAKMRFYNGGGSDKHLRDITGILRVSGDQVDRAYLQHWVEELDLAEVWQAIQRRMDADEEA